ncbi:MAG: Gfo/Idh/MocA family oxidoreductase [Alphaproteobacteria bacterium]|nr:Gfo/Idh/MocA family oxidoreductase [Alphaproteobacteria bacterium]
MLRIGLIGCGRWGRHILRDLLSLGASVSVVTRQADGAELLRAGAAAVADSVAALPPVDGFVVATPTSTHAAVIESLPAGAPIFCEKPLCDDAGRARRLLEIARDRLFVMDKWRYHEGVLALAAVARAGELGPVLGLRTTRVGWGHDYADVDCVWTLLPHELGIAREILGRALPPRGAVADRNADGVLGMVAIMADAGGPWHVAEIGARSPERQRTVTLLCRDGSARLTDAYADHIELIPSPPANGKADALPPTKRPIAVTMPLLAELKVFVDHVRGGPPPKSAAAEGAAAVETIAALRRLAGI